MVGLRWADRAQGGKKRGAGKLSVQVDDEALSRSPPASHSSDPEYSLEQMASDRSGMVRPPPPPPATPGTRRVDGLRGGDGEMHNRCGE